MQGEARRPGKATAHREAGEAGVVPDLQAERATIASCDRAGQPVGIGAAAAVPARHHIHEAWGREKREKGANSDQCVRTTTLGRPRKRMNSFGRTTKSPRRRRARCESAKSFSRNRWNHAWAPEQHTVEAPEEGRRGGHGPRTQPVPVPSVAAPAPATGVHSQSATLSSAELTRGSWRSSQLLGARTHAGRGFAARPLVLKGMRMRTTRVFVGHAFIQSKTTTTTTNSATVCVPRACAARCILFRGG